MVNGISYIQINRPEEINAFFHIYNLTARCTFRRTYSDTRIWKLVCSVLFLQGKIRLESISTLQHDFPLSILFLLHGLNLSFVQNGMLNMLPSTDKSVGYLDGLWYTFEFKFPFVCIQYLSNIKLKPSWGKILLSHVFILCSHRPMCHVRWR